ncbi:Lrp/AsnC family transcriptional regulator [Candidatus Bathyarchaeota archaeon A05DMB-2]|nr:Lrp/AsnC family transcriptional regulator [Candidatus Bathyarchaeota archaeon A05DMB-2]
MLQQNGRVAFSRIAEEIGVNEATVRYRVKQLTDRGIITKFTALLDPAKIGYSTTGIMMVKTDPALFEDAAEKISELSETYHAFQNTREFDIVAVVHTQDLKQLSDLRKKVKLIPGVKEVVVSATTRLIKIKTAFEL